MFLAKPLRGKEKGVQCRDKGGAVKRGGVIDGCGKGLEFCAGPRPGSPARAPHCRWVRVERTSSPPPLPRSSCKGRTTGSHSIGFIRSGQEDRSAGRICAIPNSIERQLGYNVISGIENLNLHRVPEPAIDAFIAVTKVRIRLFLKECESARELLRQPIAQEYRRLIVGTSLLPYLCADAAQIAEDCVRFCDHWGA